MAQLRRPRVTVHDGYRPKPSEKTGDRIPHSEKVDRGDPDRAAILITLHRFELAGVEIDDQAVEIATKLTRWHIAESAEQAEANRQKYHAARREQEERECWVYYVRCGRLIKIGMTTNLANRFSGIRPNEVLAIEPGAAELEGAMHRKFATLRAGGEYFHPGAELQQHIKDLRDRLRPPNWVRSIVPDGQDWFPPAVAEQATS